MKLTILAAAIIGIAAGTHIVLHDLTHIPHYHSFVDTITL